MSEGNDSIWNHKTCIPVQPLPGLSWEPVVQYAQAPSLRVVPGDQDDNWHDRSHRAPPRASGVQRPLSPDSKGFCVFWVLSCMG